MLPLAILAGGFATRLGSLTYKTPKSLLEVNGRPFVDWQLDLLVKNGYSDFIFCVSHKSEAIQDYLGDGGSRGISIQYSLDGDTQLGTGGAIRKALPLLGSSFGVTYGDSFLPTDYLTIEKKFLSSKCMALMAVYENQNEFDASNVKYSDGKLIKYVKGSRDANMRHIDYGVTFFTEAAFVGWEERATFDLSEVCQNLTTRGHLEGFEVFERFYEVGSLKGIEDFSQYLRSES
jgi:NDP-sugar pyrophosphorylase family protein